MKILCEKQLREAYDLLAFYRIAGNPNPEAVDVLKRQIRAYQQKEDRRWYIEDDADGYVEKSVLPEEVRSMVHAEDYFWQRKFMPPVKRAIGCAGRPFTVFHRIQKRSDGRFYLFHRVAYYNL